MSGESFAALGALMSPKDIAVLFTPEAVTPPADFKVTLADTGEQMIGTPVETPANGVDIVTLGASDVPAMIELTALIKPTIRGRRRERLLAAAHAGTDLTDINAVPDAFDERGLPVIHLARVIEYDIPDRVGNGTGELIVLLSTITDLGGDNGARADELAAAYHERWEHETSNDQLKTHLRGPGRVLRSRLPDLVHQEIWAYLIVHHAISALTAKASAAADLDPDSISFAQALRLIRRTATGTAAIPPCGLG